ncbi:bifunctional [glutamate--ammonia ligase]-adenylyl-L-tyrosine phosphorylase/[glutamate--ammonia-ligase] adenylyltransferase [Sphingomicrobium astaxanthinifaciens]|uniref:bifunctional [glutamate--ammonia ligase]-adenylyl-L-tyrosine phosphorylase/[glutamate--ammonia-ligase] adenylyltransferase n=1 Tax=Sphingomicrobium astaxanthinifaciens TaxID=1227949 RepID=UPI001FCB27BC|nr:bifunctional [glutamate--ammonia ligase]-adenylyl-L-tyrosine phosphorylase/[glutamate--ammonia-ligase] adenylyltransferase [Sphingomicrobium astaxanthinifaciens]MCJ7421663.1 bifunctional [glutamate--ammonia ligase]-adenylyl-L-tyrosine phosphorylase/[glutamate--ammonia-ligase] adenylyltransferase [Sphingomicrobium astaxanthinifaciens]
MSRNRNDRHAAWARAEAHAPFLRAAGARQAGVLETFLEAGSEAAVAAAMALECDGIGAQLRCRRDALALAVALADLSGEWGLEPVTRALSDFADMAIDRALAAAIEQRVPGAPLEGITAIALGKLGSRELNYSSDVDLILLYDPERLPVPPRREPGESAVRIARDFVALMQERTAQGYVQRVDLRLRPASEATPIALPVGAAISHYESAALPWERAAFIRARVAGGDRFLGQRFLEAIEPFVWRRAIDFGVIDEVRGIAAQVRDHYASGQAFGPGYDLKRGRGGIREIEFFVQSHQMIFGGRAPELRRGATLEALDALVQQGHFAAADAAPLAAAYRALRTAEHRLQMVADKQTHAIPEDAAAVDNVAALDGAASGAAWLARLAPHAEAVAPRFDELVAEAGGRLPADPDTLAARLGELGLADPAGAARLIAGWRAGRARSLRSAPARAAFEAMLPTMLEAIGAGPDPAHAFNRFADIVERVPSAINFYRLLEANPPLARLLGRLLAYSPTLAAQLARRPRLLDGLLDKSAFDPPRSADAFGAGLAEVIAGLDYDQALDRARALVNEKRFALGVQLIDGTVDPLVVARGYAEVAEGAIRALADRARAEFELVHGRFDGLGLAILGLGRLGGEALTHASDLDLVFLYDAPRAAQSDGAKPLTPADYYNRLASRIVSALSVPTAAGPLYEVDTRLRPQGLEGALAVSFEAFEAYQRGQAWTWEHMALTRARPVYGRSRARDRVAALLADIFGMDRDAAGTRRDAAIMRADIAAHKPPRGPLDIKLGPGGLVDLEFAVHVTQLIRREGLSPRLAEAVVLLADAGLAPATLPRDQALLTRLLLLFRLVSPDSSSPSARTRALVAERLGFENWEAAVAAHDAARQNIADYWKEVRDAQAG